MNMKMPGNQRTTRSGGVDISAGRDVYIGGDVVGRDKVTVFDAAAIQWLALETTGLVSWLRLTGTTAVLGLLVAVLSRQLFGAESITDSAAASILHGAIGAIIGGVLAWYSPSLPAALLRVAWIEGGLVAAEWVFARLMPIAPQAMPAWFGLPILHASLLVSLIGGPWLALVTYALIRVAGPGRDRPINRLWRAEAAAIVGGCLVSGLLVVGGFGSYLKSAAPPIDPSAPPELVLSQIPAWSSGAPPGCALEPGSDYYICPEAAHFKAHREGFIVLPGWLSLTQAVAILLSLAMIIPASVSLLAQTRANSPRLRRPIFVVVVGFAASAAIGLGLDLVAAALYGSQPMPRESLSLYEQLLNSSFTVALLWGGLGLATGFTTSALYSLMRRVWPKEA